MFEIVFSSFEIRCRLGRNLRLGDFSNSDFLRSFGGKTKSFVDAGVVEEDKICRGRAGECRSLIIGYLPG